nr:high-affinity glucose transporter [Quercus suber]
MNLRQRRAHAGTSIWQSYINTLTLETICSKSGDRNIKSQRRNELHIGKYLGLGPEDESLERPLPIMIPEPNSSRCGGRKENQACCEYTADRHRPHSCTLGDVLQPQTGLQPLRLPEYHHFTNPQGSLIMLRVGNIYFIAAVAVIGGGLFGFDISSMSAILGTQAYRCYFNQGPDGPPFNDATQCSGPTSSVQGGITAAMPAGSWLGSLLSGFISDRFGRKKSIMIGCILWIIGSTIICASQNIGMLVAGRVINGLCVGIESAQVPVYISELAPPTKRGRLVGAQQWAITWGILILYYVSYGASFVGGETSNDYNAAVFRIPWGIQMVPGIFLFCAMFFLPESPRWLARKDRWEECHDVLTLVHGHGDPNSPFVALEMHDIREVCALEAKNSDATYMELFKPNMINRTHVGVFTALWSQLTGMNVMMYYVTYVFGMAGYKGNANLLASSIQYVINVVMTIPALIWLDRWGRRPTLLVGSTLMMIWMFACAGNMAANGIPQPNGVDGVPEESMLLSGAAAKGLIACIYLFVASYAPTWGPVSWVYPPELYPLRLRGKAVALATSANWAFNTALGAFVPPAFENIMWKTYLIFGIFCLAMTIHVFFLFPETAGKTLEDTAFMFEDPRGIRYLGTPAWRTKVEYSVAQAKEQGTAEFSEKQKLHDDDSSPEQASPVPSKSLISPALPKCLLGWNMLALLLPWSTPQGARFSLDQTPFPDGIIMSGHQVPRKRDAFRKLFTRSRSPTVAPSLLSHPSTSSPSASASQTALPLSPGSRLLAEALSLLQPKEREIIEEHRAHGVVDINATVDHAYGAALRQKQACEDKSWQWNVRGRTVVLRDEADKVLRWLDRFKSVGDLVANVDPVHIGLPWAGIRILLEVMKRYRRLRTLTAPDRDC